MGQDLEGLQGSWKLTALELEGKEMPGGMLANAGIEIQGMRFTATGMGAVYEGAMELDASRSPWHIDMKFDAGPEKGNTNKGICEIDGGRLKICLATRGSVRPSSFASIPGSGFALETFARPEAPAAGKKKRAASGAPSSGFEGEWSMVSGIMDGRPMDESLLQWVRRVTQGNQTTVYAGPQVLMKFEFTCDASSSPGTIDYFNTAGSNKGKTQLGIYEFDGDVLTICMAAPGSPRPTGFESVPGKGNNLTVWKRA